MDTIFTLIAAALVVAIASFILWQIMEPSEDPRLFLRRFVKHRIDALLRIWAFFGPRLTHKPTMAMVVGNAAFLFGLQADAVAAEWWTLALWIGANLMFPPWDDLPNATLAGPHR